MNIHPKVGWSAFLMAVATAVFAILAAYGHSLPAAVTAGIVSILGAATGYVVPGPTAVTVTAQDSAAAL